MSPDLSACVLARALGCDATVHVGRPWGDTLAPWLTAAGTQYDAVLCCVRNSNIFDWCTHNQLKVHTTTLLRELSEQGQADSVEFRRLARKQLRPLRHAHARRVLVAEPLLCTASAIKVLRHICGRQVQLVPLTGFTAHVHAPSAAHHPAITVRSDHDLRWARPLIEHLLGRRLRDDQIGLQ